MSLVAVAAFASRSLLSAHDRCPLLIGLVEVSADALADTKE
jgi:hypothetical protein